MASVMQSIDVHVPVRTAYNQWTQFESFPQFMEGVKEVRQRDDTHLHWVAEIMARPRNGMLRSSSKCRTSAWPGQAPPARPMPAW
jgi:uncharacterized membrane protein